MLTLQQLRELVEDPAMTDEELTTVGTEIAELADIILTAIAAKKRLRSSTTHTFTDHVECDTLSPDTTIRSI